MASSLLVAGTTSDAGKSIVVTALCRAFARRGLRVAPYKAQNMSNNSMVVTGPSGTGEIGRAQWTQAAAAGADPELAAIEAGAQDFEPGEEEGTTMFWTDPGDLDLVSRALPAQGFTVLSAKLGYKPKNPVDPASLDATQLEEVEAFLAAIDQHDDVQNIFVGLAG